MRTVTAPRSNRPAPQPIAIAAMRTTKKAAPAPVAKKAAPVAKKAAPVAKKAAPAPVAKKAAPKVEVKRQSKEEAKKAAPKVEPKPAPLPLSPEEMVTLYRHLDKVLASTKSEVMELPDLFLQIPLSLRNRPETATFRKFFSTLVGLGFVINPHEAKAKAKKEAPQPLPLKDAAKLAKKTGKSVLATTKTPSAPAKKATAKKATPAPQPVAKKAAKKAAPSNVKVTKKAAKK